MLARISKSGAISVVCFLILSILSRFLFPFGDEPDWSIRAPGVVESDHPWFSPYYWLGAFFRDLSTNAEACVVDASPMSMWAYIPGTCGENIEQVLARFLSQMIMMLPLFYVLIFKADFVRIAVRLNRSISTQEWFFRLNVLSVAILFPGMIYYLGVFAEEQFFLFVTFFVFLFWGCWALLLPLFFILSAIDFGNTVVVCFFMMAMILFSWIDRQFSGKTFYLMLLSGVLFAYFVGFEFLGYFSYIELYLGTSDIVNKGDAMYAALENQELINKYPVILRPVITFMSMVFMTPSGVKSLLAYLIVGLFFFHFFKRLGFKLFVEDGTLRVYFFVPIFTVMVMVFLFPTYANAKYYMFLFPFVLYVVLDVLSIKVVSSFFGVTSTVVLLNLLLYRI